MRKKAPLLSHHRISFNTHNNMTEFGSVVAHVIGLPKGTSLGDLEGLILPRINGRIVAIGLGRGADEGTAVIEFARAADAGVSAVPLRESGAARP